MLYLLHRQMAPTRRRKAPSKDAAEHIATGLDKTAHLEVKFINPLKGTV